MGKFLYNKRLDPKTHEPRQMTLKELSHKQKPRFYEKHSELIGQSLLEPSVISLYLHENMLNFFNDVEDIANCWSIYSELDGIKSRLQYEYANSMYV